MWDSYHFPSHGEAHQLLTKVLENPPFEPNRKNNVDKSQISFYSFVFLNAQYCAPGRKSAWKLSVWIRKSNKIKLWIFQRWHLWRRRQENKNKQKNNGMFFLDLLRLTSSREKWNFVSRAALHLMLPKASNDTNPNNKIIIFIYFYLFIFFTDQHSVKPHPRNYLSVIPSITKSASGVNDEKLFKNWPTGG